MRDSEGDVMTANLTDARTMPPIGNAVVVARIGYEVRLIPLTSIKVFQACEKSVMVFHCDGEVIIKESLSSLAARCESFVRINRGLLINPKYLLTVRLPPVISGQPPEVSMLGMPYPLPISRRHRPMITKWLRSHA